MMTCYGDICTEPVIINIDEHMDCTVLQEAPGGGGGGGEPDGNDCYMPDPWIEGVMLQCPEDLGDKPLYEYSNKCQGLQDIWNNFPNNEMYGYITTDGKLIVTGQVGYGGGQASGTYIYNGVTYYPYPKSQGVPSLSYNGMLTNNEYYFIPVVASVHTHSPCRTDGTNGVSQSVSNDDVAAATSHPELNHWVIGCNAIAQFNSSDSSYYNIQTGNISTTCETIH